MKRTKSILAVVLALTLVFVSGIVAFAAGTYSITIRNDAPGHTYEAYQIFAGDLHEKILSNIVWGNGISDEGKTKFGDAATKAAAIKTEADAKAFAKEIAQYLTTSKESAAQSEGKYVIDGLSAGYYLVKDKDNTLVNADDFNTAYIMEVVGNVVATPKGSKPSLDKQIKHNESSTWGVVGDNQIGDTVEFRTITTVPDITGYVSYDYIIHDTMSVGLTSNVKTVADVTIKVNDTDVLPTAYYTVTATGNTFSVKVDVFKAITDGIMKAGDKLYTYYSGVLNAEAKVYDEGKQSNTAYLEYSNNPNKEDEHGKTQDKTVYDWTFKMGVNKIDGVSGTALNGAKFVLSKKGDLKVADLKCDKDGVPTVTTGLIGLVKVADGVYRVAVEGEANVVYVIDAGSAVIKGLDDAIDYYLYETKAPDGYNRLQGPVKFKISAEYNTDGSNYTSVTATVGDTEATGLQANIKNNKGTELPSTGGIGTTIFYIVGAVLVAAAGVLLITKKRMSRSAD